DRRAAGAATPRARLTGRARGAVAAWRAVGFRGADALVERLVARPDATLIPRGAAVARRTDARPVRTRVADCAEAAVVARQGGVRVEAAGGRVAAVGRARIAVAAIERGVAGAHATAANVARGTGVVIVAQQGVVRVRAARRRVAAVGRARVAVVAVERRA